MNSLRAEFDEGDVSNHALHDLRRDPHEHIADDAKNGAGQEDGSEALYERWQHRVWFPTFL